MSLEEPLAAFHVGSAGSADELSVFLEHQGLAPERLFARGGPPVALVDGSLFLVDEGEIYRIDRERVVGLGATRAADKGMMRWGVLLYLLALPGFYLNWIVAGLMAIGGGVLVTLGYLSKALLIQVDDDRLPPFVIDHRRWKSIRDEIHDWA